MMVEQWLEWARGPIFLACFSIMVFGLARVFFLTWFSIFRAIRIAANKKFPVKKILIDTASWLIPFKHIMRDGRKFYGISSFVFHIGLLLTPIFLAAHIVLLQRGFGLWWPGLGQGFADFLTILTIASGVVLIVGRLFSPSSRQISRVQDYLIPPLLLIPFVTGFLAMHPNTNPFSYNATMLVHVMSSNLIFILMPFTKLAHSVLMPMSQLISEIGWHFPADSGRNVGIALGKDGEKI